MRTRTLVLLAILFAFLLVACVIEDLDMDRRDLSKSSPTPPMVLEGTREIDLWMDRHKTPGSPYGN